MNLKIIFILVALCISFVNCSNPNTAVSGAGNNYASFTSETLGVEISDVQRYDDIGEDFTIELWFRKTCGQGEYRPLVSKHPQTPGVIRNVPNGNTEFLLEVQYNDSINFFTGCGGFADYGYYVAVDQRVFFPNHQKYTVIRNRWTHVAVTVNWKEDEIGIPTGVATLYIDGIIVDSSIWASESPQCFGKRRLRATGEPVRLGFFDNQDQGVQTWCGDMDELRIWSVARTPEQIKHFYQGGLPPNSEGIVSYHTFSESPGSMVSNNVVSQDGRPQVIFNAPFPSGFDFLRPSELKLCPNPGVACNGYTVSARFFGFDRTGADFDFYVTDIVRNTDAKFLWSDKRNPTRNNIRREITEHDLPLNVGRNNLIEYVPGKVAGIDLLYYEARNNVTFPEPNGPAKLFFISKCCGTVQPDECRVCGGNGSDCSVSCDHKGGVKDECGMCNGNGQSCRGCDNRPFSPKKFDICGVCGGDNESCMGSCTGFLDQCGVCNGTNECCLSYKGVSKDRLNWILLEHGMGIAHKQLEHVKELIEQTSGFVEAHNKRHRLNEFDPTGVVLPSTLPSSLSSHIFNMNKFCEETGSLLAVIDAFVDDLGTQIRNPFPKVSFPHVTQ